MTSASNVVFVCVPGAFCPGIYYSKVVALLESHGFEAIYVDLPTLDVQLRADGHFPGMDDDAAHVRSVCSSYIKKSKSIVLVANSYGGIVASEACKGIVQDIHDKSGSAGVCHLVLLASLLAIAGKNVLQLLSTTNAIAGSLESPGADNPVWSSPRDPADMGRLLCGSLPADQQLSYGRLTRAQSSRAKTVPVTYEAWKDVPTTMIIPELDAALPVQAQDQSFDKGQSESSQTLRKILLKDADHAPILTNPEDIIKICVDIADSWSKQAK